MANILVIDDETEVRYAIRAVLEDQGHDVSEAETGTAGLSAIADAPDPYDLVICDLKMPKRDGIAFYKALADSVPAMSKRVMFVTGDVAGTNAEQFLNETGCRWLAKPFRLGDLLRAVREELS